MSELRWNPQLKQWVIVATHRQERTYKPPAEFCPLCPTKPGAFPSEVPAEAYEIVVFENKFAALKQQPSLPGVEGSPLYPVAPAQGVCEVVLYSSKHNSTLGDADVQDIDNLIQVWTDRYQEIGGQEGIEYVLIFENKGEAVGVTLHHPHGQIYGFPFIPPVLEKELASAQSHLQETGRCLYCDILSEELDGERVIVAGEYFTAFVPFFARYPYEVHIYANNHLGSLAGMTRSQQRDLAGVMKALIGRYDALFGFALPYVMVLHQTPSKGEHPYYHFHMEFTPLHRSESKLKYLAGVETGAGTFLTDLSPEDQAKRLRGENP